MPNRRRYPRLDFDGPAILEVRPHGSGRSSSERAPIPVDIIVTSISCEGAGFKTVGAIPMVLGSGKSVRLCMLGPKGEQLMLPASVKWTRDLLDGSVDVGLELHLALTDSITRQTYAYWVVEKSVAAERAAKAAESAESASPPQQQAARGSHPRLREQAAAERALPRGADVVSSMRPRPTRPTPDTKRSAATTPARGNNVSVKVSREALRRALLQGKERS